MLANPPSIRRRLASAIYDCLLLIGVLIATFVLPHTIVGLAFQVSTPGAFLVGHLVAVIAAYFLWYWSHGGQTLPMQTWKIRLVAAHGGPPSWQRLLLRFLLAWPSYGFYGIGVLWALFDRERQYLHDRIAGTRIVFS